MAGDGYLQVILYKDGKREHRYIHRLVAEAYIPNPLGLPEVHHISENKTENHVNNLAWVSHQDNCNHGTHNERMARSRGKPVYCVELDQIFYGARAAARELGVQQSGITKCCSGKQKTAGGYHWRYADELLAEKTS